MHTSMATNGQAPKEELLEESIQQRSNGNYIFTDVVGKPQSCSESMLQNTVMVRFQLERKNSSQPSEFLATKRAAWQ
jgi:hypothetical protein